MTNGIPSRWFHYTDNYRQLFNDAVSFSEINRHVEGWEIVLTRPFQYGDSA
jgi:hypothetical protein